MDDLQSQLLGHAVLPKPYAAAFDHPAWITICGFYQTASSATGLRGMTLWNIATPVLLGVNLCLFLGLARQLRFTRSQSIGLTAAFLATRASITRSVVLETHVLAPTGLLLAALILTNRRFTSRPWGRPTLNPGGLWSHRRFRIDHHHQHHACTWRRPVNVFRHSNPSRLASRMTS